MHGLKTTSWTAAVYVSVPLLYDVLLISAQPLMAIHTKTKGKCDSGILESSSRGSSLQCDDACDASSQIKKTVPSFCHLKWICFTFEEGAWYFTTRLSELLPLFIGRILWKAETEYNFLWINPECVELHHGTRVLLLYLTSFTENDAVRHTRLGASNRKNYPHWLDKITRMVCCFHLTSWSGESQRGRAGERGSMMFSTIETWVIHSGVHFIAGRWLYTDSDMFVNYLQ